MADQKTRLVLNDFSGGRNAIDSPLGPNFASNQVTDATNGDWHHTSGFRKRSGSSLLGMVGSVFTGIVSWIGRYVPGTSEGNAEFWGIDTAGQVGRLKNSATWAAVTVVEGPTIGTHTWDFTSTTLNGKFFIAYPSSSTRLHVYDPDTGTLRKTGIDPGSTAPLITDDGAGAYPATPQYFRVRYGRSVAGIWVLLSEPTPPGAITPSGAGSGVTIFRPPGLPGDGENIWLVEASTDNVNFRVLAAVSPVATLSYTNIVAPTSWTALELSPSTGTYTLQKPYRFVAADQNRLIGFGSFDTTAPQHRLEWSAIVGGTNLYNGVAATGAEERVDTTILSYRDLDENDSGVPSALIGPIWGNFYPFKTRQMWEASPTGSTDQPYRITAITKELGCVGPHAVCRGEDGHGNACLYFMAHRGGYRYGEGGIAFIGNGMEDYILGPTATLNLQAANVICHLVYHQEKRQLWVWFATGTSDDPNELFVFDVRANQGQGAWTRYTGAVANARCSVMAPDTIGATMGTPLVPYIGDPDTVNTILKCDDAAALNDRGTPFAASLTTRPLEVPGFKVETGDVIVLAPTATGVTLHATLTPDFGASDGVDGDADLSALQSEFNPTRVSRRCEGTALGQAEFIQLTIGDEVAVANAWSLDRVVIPIKRQQATS